MELPCGGALRSLDPRSPAYSESQSSADEPEVEPRNLKQALVSPSITSDSSPPPPKGYRAAEAYIRPSPIYVSGNLESHLFDLQSCTFTMSLTAKTATTTDAPTEIYLPDFHFPGASTAVAVSGGKWEMDYQEVQSIKVQRLRWWHAEGEQDIKVEGAKRQPGEFTNTSGDDVTYLGQCQRGQCILM